jgi:hypothetical protein
MATQTASQKAMASKAASELGVTIPTGTTAPTAPAAEPVTSQPSSADVFQAELAKKILGQADIVSSLDTGVEQTYNTAIAGIQGGVEANTARVTSEYDRQIGYRQTTGGYQLTNELEGRRGLATSRVALISLDSEIQKDIKDLEQRKQELILTGEAEAASAIAGLQVDKLKFQAEAKQKYFSNLLNMGTYVQGQQNYAEGQRQFNVEQTAAQKRDEFNRMASDRSFALEEQQFAEGNRQFEKNFGFSLMKFGAEEDQRAFDKEMSREQLALSKQQMSLGWANYGLSKELNAAQIKKLEYEMSPTVGEQGMNMPNMGPNGETINFKPNPGLTAKQEEQVGAAKEGVLLINNAEFLYRKAVASETPGASVLEGPLKWALGEGGYATSIKGNAREFGAWTGKSPEWKAYKDYLISNKAGIAKGIGGESGNLAAQEQVDALLRLDATKDTPANASQKFQLAKDTMVTRLGTLGTISNANMSTNAGSALAPGATGKTSTGLTYIVE